MVRKSIINKLRLVVLSVVAIGALTGCGSINKESGSATTVEPAPYVDEKDTNDNNTGDNDATAEDNNDKGSTGEADYEDTNASDIDAPEGLDFSKVNSYLPATAEWDMIDWIYEAEDLFERACLYDWKYRQNGYIETDFDDFIEIDGNTYYRAVDYNSRVEATADFYSVFSEEGRENMFDDVMIEQDNKLYLIQGSRGANIFYIDSEVVSVDKVEDGKVYYTVKSSYYDPDYYEKEDQEKHIKDETHAFSIIFERGAWRVSEFSLPY